jgi:hypothetical protein
MKVDYEAISEIFRLYDIDGLISSGAPDDEYEPEVERIVLELEKLSRQQASAPIIAGIIAAVWEQMIAGSEEQMQRRRFGFDEIAEKVMRFFA